MIDHQRQIARRGHIDQSARLLGRAAHRLLDKHMLSGGKRRAGQWEMCRDRRGDHYGVDGGVVEKLPIAFGEHDAGITRGKARQPRAVEIAYRDNARIGKLAEVAYEVWSPVAVSNNSDSSHSALPRISVNRTVYGASARASVPRGI